jgi:glycosyltransferase involved in cell wall biosynthesis
LVVRPEHIRRRGAAKGKLAGEPPDRIIALTTRAASATVRARMSEKPLVSVVVPTRNRRALLQRCVEAVAAQDWRPLELIVVDDASTDDTPSFLADFAARHADVSVVALRNSSQAGANPSRNRAIRESRGEYVAFLDDDCIAEAGWLTRLMAGFASEQVAAVTGRVDDPPPENLFELTFKGTHRVHGRQQATRLVAGNMVVRRELLCRYMLDEDRSRPDADTSVSGRGDEDGLFLALRAAGFEVRLAADAGVLHDHHYSGKAFFRQAYRSGGAAARFGYKYRLPPRVELTPLALGWLLLPLSVIPRGWWLLPAVCFGLFLAAVLYNEVARKGKTPVELLITLPLILAYNHVRLAGYVTQHFRLWTGMDKLSRAK